MEAFQGMAFQAKLVKPANIHEKQRNIIYFRDLKQVLNFTQHYRERFSHEFRVKQMHQLLNQGGTYMRDYLYNEYYFLRILF